MSGISFPRPQPTEYLFIDGGCLRAEVCNLAERYTGDRQGVTITFENLRRHFTKVFYYDAVPAQNHGEDREAWIERIRPQLTTSQKYEPSAASTSSSEICAVVPEISDKSEWTFRSQSTCCYIRFGIIWTNAPCLPAMSTFSL